MVATLRLNLDASGAATGAAQFEQATARVQRSAVQAAGAVGRGGTGGRSLEAAFRDADLAMSRAEARVKAMDVSLVKQAASTDKATQAQRAFGRALDVGGNFAKGFATALAIAPVVAIGSALASAAIEALGFGDGMDKAAEQAKKLASEADSVRESVARLNAEMVLAARYPGAFGGDAADMARGRLGQIQNLAGSMQEALSGGTREISSEQREALAALGVNLSKPSFATQPTLYDAIGALSREADRVRADIARMQAEAALAKAAARETASPLSSFDIAALIEGTPRAPRRPFEMLATADEASLYAGAAGIGMGPLGRDQLSVFLASNPEPRYAPDMAGYQAWQAGIGFAGYSDGGGEQFGPPAAEAEEQLRVLDEAQRSAANVGSTFANSMEQALLSAQDLGDGLQGVFRATLAAIFHELVTEKIATEVSTVALAALVKDGGAFAGGHLVPMASGGIVSAPTYFPLAGGKVGLMGEAGAEAVMPLARGADGKLGVKSAGGGAPTIIFNVQATDAASFRKSGPQIMSDLRRALAGGR